MNDADKDKLAGILYCAYEGDCTQTDWDALKREYPILTRCWHRVAEAALAAIVVVKVQ